MKHHLERLWQVWWAQWHQTWASQSLLKQNPPHFKLSRFLIPGNNSPTMLFCSCRRLTGAWRSFAMASVSLLKTTWLSGQSPPMTTKENVMCISLFQRLCQHLLRVAVGPFAQSKALCAKVLSSPHPSRIHLPLDYWQFPGLFWSSQTCMQERLSHTSTTFLSQGREKVSQLKQPLILLCKSQFELHVCVWMSGLKFWHELVYFGCLFHIIRVHLNAESAFSNMYHISSVAFSLPGHR